MKIITDRLILKPIQIEDKIKIFEYRSDTETNKYQGWIPKDIKDVEVFIKKISNTIDIPDTWFQFVIIEKQSNNLIGDLGIHFLDTDNKQVEIGCTLNKSFQGKGYATEAVSKIIDYLFLELKKNRIKASIDPDNIKSIKLFERIGFKKEAHYAKSLFINGKWIDDLIYILTKNDWKNLISLN